MASMRFSCRDHDGTRIDVEQIEDGTYRYRRAGTDDDWTPGLTDLARDKLERNRRWNEENREALATYAREVEGCALPLERYRLF